MIHKKLFSVGVRAGRCPKCRKFHGLDWKAKDCWQRQKLYVHMDRRQSRKRPPGRPIGADGKPTDY